MCIVAPCDAYSYDVLSKVSKTGEGGFTEREHKRYIWFVQREDYIYTNWREIEYRELTGISKVQYEPTINIKKSLSSKIENMLIN